MTIRTRFKPNRGALLLLGCLVIAIIILEQYDIASNQIQYPKPPTAQAIASGSSLPSWAQSWAGVPWDVTNSGNSLISAQLDDDKIRIAARGNWIYRTGYIWNAKTHQWSAFTFPSTSAYSGWAQDIAVTDVPLKSDEILNGDNYVLAYTCQWKDKWYCGCLNAQTGADGVLQNCGRWQLQTFTAYRPDSVREYMVRYLKDPPSVPNFREIARSTIVAAEETAYEPKGDFDEDGTVDFDDFFMFADAFGKQERQPGYDSKFDLSVNKKIDFDDFFIFADDFGKSAPFGIRPKNVAIIEFALADTQYQSNAGYIDKTFLELVNAPEGYTIVKAPGGTNLKFESLYGIDDWFRKEYKRITGKDKKIFNIEVFGPFVVNEKPPQAWYNDPCSSDLRDYFVKGAMKNGIDTNKYDILNFVFFDDLQHGTDFANGAFWSCAYNDGQQRVTFTDFLAFLTSIFDGIEIVTHETFHILGAYDTYDGFACKDQEGLPDPNKIPKYPQNKACLMCGSIAISKSETVRPASFEDMVICDSEAEAAGWKDNDTEGTITESTA